MISDAGSDFYADATGLTLSTSFGVLNGNGYFSHGSIDKPASHKFAAQQPLHGYTKESVHTDKLEPHAPVRCSTAQLLERRLRDDGDDSSPGLLRIDR